MEAKASNFKRKIFLFVEKIFFAEFYKNYYKILVGLHKHTIPLFEINSIPISEKSLIYVRAMSKQLILLNFIEAYQQQDSSELQLTWLVVT